MKRLNDYILEQQNTCPDYFINESGLRDTLFGSIVMKLLDTGLSWIEKGVGWMADTLKEAAAGAWDSLKGVSKKTLNSAMEQVRSRGKIDKKHKDPFSAYIYGAETPEERVKRGLEIKDILEKEGVDSNQSTEWFVRQVGPTLLVTKYNKKSSKKEVAEAEKLLENIKNKWPKLYAKHLEKLEKKLIKDTKSDTKTDTKTDKKTGAEK